MTQAARRALDYLQVFSLPVAGLILLYTLRSDLHGGLPPLVFRLLPVPFAWFMWLRTMDEDRPVSRRFSWLFLALTLGAYAGMYLYEYDADWRVWGATVGTLLGPLTWISAQDCLRRIREEVRPLLVACCIGVSSAAYLWLNDRLWREMAHSTALLIHWILSSMGVTDSVEYNGRRMITIKAVYYGVELHQGCSGMEGIFLFMFLLSSSLLLDWRLFRRFHLFELYLIGFLYMFVMNVLRIFYLYAVGSFAWNPESPPWAQSMRGWPLEFFHGGAGWMFYLVAFILFIWVLYRMAAKRQRNVA